MLRSDEEIPAAAIWGRQIEVRSCDEAYVHTLSEVLENGHSTGGDEPSRELLDFRVLVSESRSRVLQNPAGGFRIIDAVARFVWMVAGNERVEDIAFYQPRVRGYSDDQLIVPGSNYGKRLFAPRPGVNQIEGAIGRLRDGIEEGGGGRRAACVIWQAEDAVRESADIPCAFGVFFHICNSALYTSVLFRSNNATTLLPVNLFEFGLLAEVVAAEVGLEMGPLLHSASSMHVFDEQRARQAIAGYEKLRGTRVESMAPVPASPRPLEQAYELARLEAKLRQELDAIRDEDIKQLCARGDALNDYWRALYRVLLAHALVRLDRPAVARRLAGELPAPLARPTLSHVEQNSPPESAGQPPDALFAEEDGELEVRDGDSRQVAALNRMLGEIETEFDRELTRVEYLLLKHEFVGELIAARSEHEVAFSQAEIEARLRKLRERPR